MYSFKIINKIETLTAASQKTLHKFTCTVFVILYITLYMYNRVEKRRVGVPLGINFQKVEIELRSLTVNIIWEGWNNN